MCTLNLLYVLLFNMMFKDVVSIRPTLCRRQEVENHCVEENTWVFDINSQTCDPVIPNKEPCGLFISEKACKEVCLKKNSTIVLDLTTLEKPRTKGRIYK
ncbi:uncharacterized protein Dere_GG26894 [Drosophila erecta]|uniref:BPTI/Kunitz inhibitor domain-containing protein n=2 Tax=Drosophila erecta TaxID=7220 RepID=A0A0Q5WB88_DROER|nr:uncharacterized protein Dere_GG26894 [Drosophila erecta]